MQFYIHCSLIYNSQDMEATKVPTSRWLVKEEVVYIYNGILLDHKKEKKNGILPFATAWMDNRGYCAKYNKSVENVQIPYDFTYMWNL